MIDTFHLFPVDVVQQRWLALVVAERLHLDHR